MYFCGALKNLSGNNKLLKELSNRNLVKILANILKSLSQFVSKKLFLLFICYRILFVILKV